MFRIFRTIPAASLRLLVFDLDGTLIDSGADLCASVNAMLVHFGRAPLPQAVISSYIGDGAARLVSRSLGEPEDPAFLDAALTYFLDYYREHKLDHTYVYPGVFSALDSLRAQRSMAVLTNKPINPSLAICEALGLSPYFFRILGGNSFATKKPDPEGLHALIKEAGVSPQETLMIGDSDVDILTARSAGVWSIGCSYGLSPHTLAEVPPDSMVDSPEEWPLVLATNSVYSTG
jgi:phosphoglycolate phosphatase